MIQIIPAILATSEEDYKRDIARYKKEKLFDWVHIDFADNKFVPNQSISPVVTAKYPTDLHKEAHLMILQPLEWIDSLIAFGFERIILHIEAEDVEETLKYIISKGIKVGLAIKNETAIEKLPRFIGKIGMILVMSIEPGFQGQPFINESLNKISRIKNYNWPVKIAVDGAIKDQNAASLVKAGVDCLIVGSYLLKGNIDENLKKIRAAIK